MTCPSLQHSTGLPLNLRLEHKSLRPGIEKLGRAFAFGYNGQPAGGRYTAQSFQGLSYESHAASVLTARHLHLLADGAGAAIAAQ